MWPLWLLDYIIAKISKKADKKSRNEEKPLKPQINSAITAKEP